MVGRAYHPHPHRPNASPGAGSVPQEDLLQRSRRVQRVGGKHPGRGEEHQLLCNDLEFGILYWGTSAALQCKFWILYCNRLVASPQCEYVPGILSEGDSSGKRPWDWFCSEGFGGMTPPTMYQGRSWWTGGSDLGFEIVLMIRVGSVLCIITFCSASALILFEGLVNEVSG